MTRIVGRIATLLAALCLLASSAMLAACNTVEGAGEDLKKASQNTRKAIAGDEHDENQ